MVMTNVTTNVMTCFSIITEREQATDLICLSHAGGSTVTKSIFSNSAKCYIWHEEQIVKVTVKIIF